MKKKQVIRLNESQLKRIVKESVRMVLKEGENTSFEDVPKLLAQGVRLKDIFDKIYPESEGFYFVVLNNKVNYVSTERKLLSPLWFSEGSDFHDGWASVGIDRREGGSWNLINTKGEFFSTEWAHEPWEIISWQREVWGDSPNHTYKNPIFIRK